MRREPSRLGRAAVPRAANGKAGWELARCLGLQSISGTEKGRCRGTRSRVKREEGFVHPNSYRDLTVKGLI